MTDKNENECMELTTIPGVRYKFRLCGNATKYFEDGQWWCGQHTPSKRREREDAREQKRNSPELLRQKLDEAERELHWTQERVDKIKQQLADAEETK